MYTLSMFIYTFHVYMLCFGGLSNGFRGFKKIYLWCIYPNSINTCVRTVYIHMYTWYTCIKNTLCMYMLCTAYANMSNLYIVLSIVHCTLHVHSTLYSPCTQLNCLYIYVYIYAMYTCVVYMCMYVYNCKACAYIVLCTYTTAQPMYTCVCILYCACTYES